MESFYGLFTPTPCIKKTLSLPQEMEETLNQTVFQPTFLRETHVPFAGDGGSKEICGVGSTTSVLTMSQHSRTMGVLGGETAPSLSMTGTQHLPGVKRGVCFRISHSCGPAGNKYSPWFPLEDRLTKHIRHCRMDQDKAEATALNLQTP